MAILWCGGEDVDFPTGGVTVVTTSNHYRANYARESVYCLTNNAKSNAFAGGAITSGWLGVRIYTGSTSGTSKRIIGLGDSTTTASGLYLSGSSAAGSRLALAKFDGTTHTQLAAESGNSLTTAALQVDMHVQSYGASATVDVYTNGGASPLFSYSGDVTVSGVTAVDCVMLAGDNSGGSFRAESSEIIVSSTDTRPLSLVTMAPNAAGTNSNWTGAYSTINGTTISDTSPNYVDTDAADMQYNLLGIPSGVFLVDACKITARLAKSVSGTATRVSLGVTKNGSSIDVDAAHTLTTAYAPYERLMTLDPLTSAAWLASDMAGLQINLRSST